MFAAGTSPMVCHWWLACAKLASLGFNVNADLLYALEIFEDEIKGRDVERN